MDDDELLHRCVVFVYGILDSLEPELPNQIHHIIAVMRNTVILIAELDTPCENFLQTLLDGYESRMRVVYGSKYIKWELDREDFKDTVMRYKMDYL